VVGHARELIAARGVAAVRAKLDELAQEAALSATEGAA